MTEHGWSEELDGVFRQVKIVKEDVKENLNAIYLRRGLAWDDQIIKNLSGDIHSKILGAYLGKKLAESGVEPNISYEVILRPTMLRADIFINRKITVESKAQGIFSLDSLNKRWLKLSQELPELIHLLVSWHHNPSYVKQIRKFIPESNHYYFHNLLSHENQPLELERLVKNITNWLRESR
jgi:hypothetical protein